MEEIKVPFTLILGNVLVGGTKAAIFVQKLPAQTEQLHAELSQAIQKLPANTLIEKKMLAIEIKPAEEQHAGLDHKFSFKELDVLSFAVPDTPRGPPCIPDIRELVNELSTRFSGKTFTEVDFNNAVFALASGSRDDNRNLDECINDASTTILYLFLYGFLHDIMSTVNTDVTNLWYNEQPQKSN